jgi:hypothetical protein
MQMALQQQLLQEQQQDPVMLAVNSLPALYLRSSIHPNPAALQRIKQQRRQLMHGTA